MFFGREGVVEELLEAAAARLTAPGPLIVSGASGVGKSSLLRAGLLARIASDGLPGAPEVAGWPRVIVTAGSLLDDERPGQTLQRLTGERVVLVADQFEELFAPSVEEVVRAPVIRTLAELTRPGGAVVVIGIRSDHYGTCTDHRPDGTDAPPLATGGTVFVRPMGPSELRSVITMPAEAVGLAVDENLVQMILADLDAHSSALRRTSVLPFLSHALLSTWQQHAGRRLTVAQYVATGRVDGAVAATAERLYTGFDTEGRDEARRLLLSLVYVSDGTGEDHRRLVGRTDLPLDGRGTAVLEALIRARLVTVGRGEDNGEDIVQISHDAVLEAWPRLGQWIEEGRQDLLVRQKLKASVADWIATAYGDASLLYAGARLDAAQTYAQHARLTTDENEFLKASERKKRQHTRRLRQVIGILTTLLLLSAGLTGYAFQLRSKAESNARLAASRQLALQAATTGERQPALALAQSLAALRAADTREARDALRAELLRDPRRVAFFPAPGGATALAATPDGSVTAVASADGAVTLWDAEQRALLPALPDGKRAAYRLAIDEKGRRLAIGGPGIVDVYDIPARRFVVTGLRMGENNEPVQGLAFSPDGRTLAAVGGDRFMTVWNTHDWKGGSPAWHVTAAVPSAATTEPYGSSRSRTGHSQAAPLLDTAIPLPASPA